MSVNAELSHKDILRRLNHLPSTFECGVHSGFPTCCIIFYMTRKMWMSESENRDYNKLIHQKMKMILDEDGEYIKHIPGYIPCPKCLESENFVTDIKPCECNHSEEQAGNIYAGEKI